jgi:hypothetical protein
MIGYNDAVLAPQRPPPKANQGIKTMTRHSHPKRLLSCLIATVACSASATALADFIDDGTASLELRNMYMNRDFRQTGGGETQEDWGQGFTLRYKSGFTDGSVGFGVDALAQLGVKLDSGKGRSGTGVLAVDRDGTPADDYSELGLTAKARLSNSTLFLGTLQPTLPVAQYNDTRLLSSTYSGGMVNSKEIQDLDFNAGRITKANYRDSSNRDDIGYASADSDHFDFAGGAYAITPQLTASYYYGDLADIYKQHFVGLVHVLPLSDSMSLRTDLRYFKSTDNGNRLAGKIDNDFFNGMLSLSSGAHKFSGALQRLSGDGNFPFLRGGDPYSVNLVTFNTFTKAETDAWQLRYDFNFAELGIPGLAFMTRYTSGRNIEQGAVRDGREWERDSDLVYTLQEGTLKGLNIRLRNVTFRSGDGLKTDVDENRLIVGYTLPLW